MAKEQEKKLIEPHEDDTLVTAREIFVRRAAELSWDVSQETLELVAEFAVAAAYEFETVAANSDMLTPTRNE